MTRQDAVRLVADLETRGFSPQIYAHGHRYVVSIRCDQCEALAINGIATHETGCPRQRLAERQWEEEDQ